MPELPEVETTRRGISPLASGTRVKDVIVRDSRLRWPVPRKLGAHIIGQQIDRITRRGKYLIFWMERGALIIHLGMSGSLRIVNIATSPAKHDHYDLVLDTGLAVRYRDPRRFGSIHWTTNNPMDHKLLINLGPEPLSDRFTGDYLYYRGRNRATKVKTLIMNSSIVPGVGNIYANEALFLGRIRPGTRASRITIRRYERLASSIKHVLTDAIEQGGTTLRDFVDSNGRPGYFQQSLYVYGRAGLACRLCGNVIKSRNQHQRATYYCTSCQF